MTEHAYIACDLGAASGRVMVGSIGAGRLAIEEVHRFPNDAVRIRGTLRWNLLRIFEELKEGLRKAVGAGRPLASLSVDSWGADYALIHQREPMVSLAYHYRDSRTDDIFAEASKQAELIFAETGIQSMAINTLYQLIAEVRCNPDLIEVTHQFLNIADYFNFLFSSVPRAEESLASTSQLYNPVTRQWSAKLTDVFELPPRIFPSLVPSGTRLGPLVPEIRAEAGLAEVEVIATCSHDTGAAVVAVPAEGDDWAFLSSGTWSLFGVELSAPLINEEVRSRSFTNEAGYGGTTRFQKNIIGLWLLQECQRTWQRDGKNVDHDGLTRLAGEVQPFRSLINPNNARFAKPDEMPEKIAAFCCETAQPVPETPGQFARCVFESLALLYRETMNDLEQLCGQRIRRLHIVGGGSRSALLNQFAANATGCTVLAGPVEAAAAGNVLVQAITLGHVASLQSAREIVRGSFAISEFQPADPAEWQLASARFAKIICRT